MSMATRWTSRCRTRRGCMPRGARGLGRPVSTDVDPTCRTGESESGEQRSGHDQQQHGRSTDQGQRPRQRPAQPVPVGDPTPEHTPPLSVACDPRLTAHGREAAWVCPVRRRPLYGAAAFVTCRASPPRPDDEPRPARGPPAAGPVPLVSPGGCGRRGDGCARPAPRLLGPAQTGR